MFTTLSCKLHYDRATFQMDTYQVRFILIWKSIRNVIVQLPISGHLMYPNWDIESDQSKAWVSCWQIIPLPSKLQASVVVSLSQVELEILLPTIESQEFIGCAMNNKDNGVDVVLEKEGSNVIESNRRWHDSFEVPCEQKDDEGISSTSSSSSDKESSIDLAIETWVDVEEKESLSEKSIAEEELVHRFIER